jgi:hypothetical protein
MDNHEYINQNLIPLLEEVTVQLLLDKPEDPIPAMIKYLRDKGGYDVNGMNFSIKDYLMIKKEISITYVRI